MTPVQRANRTIAGIALCCVFIPAALFSGCLVWVTHTDTSPIGDKAAQPAASTEAKARSLFASAESQSHVPPGNPDEQVYAERLLRYEALQRAATEAVLRQSAKATEDSTVLFDDSWRKETAVALATLAAVGESVDKLGTAPARYKKADRYVRKAAAEAVKYAAAYAAGVDSVSARSLLNADQHLQRLTLYTQKATSLIPKPKD